MEPNASSATTFARLRIDVPDHPGALAAVSRVLADLAMNVVEVSIHEVEGDRATDEIVVHSDAIPDFHDLRDAIAAAGAELLSMCSTPRGSRSCFGTRIARRPNQAPGCSRRGTGCPPGTSCSVCGRMPCGSPPPN
jgi:predicted amino acid-binding ACT domain protein